MNDDEEVLAQIKKQQKKLESLQSHKLKTEGGVNAIIGVVEEFLQKQKLICYGGTALNNLLPEKEQFYSKEEIPDYDFFSPEPIKHAKQLADEFHKKGFIDVEAKAGMHSGTYKVFVNFLAIADITFMPRELFTKIQNECVEKNKILYAPPNYLLMMIYNELALPNGNISRWEKVYKRFSLFIKYYPIQVKNCPKKLPDNQFAYKKIKEMRDDNAILVGANAREFYNRSEGNTDCVYISRNYEETTNRILEILWNYTEDINVKSHDAFYEFLPHHYEILVGKKTVAVIFEEFEGMCLNYNRVNDQNVATTDTLLLLYLMFVYIDKPYLPSYFYLCKSDTLFRIQQTNKTKNTGVFKRFDIPCIGNQITLKDIKKIKQLKFMELKKSKNVEEYDKWFLNYSPMRKKKNERYKYSKNDLATTKVM